MKSFFYLSMFGYPLRLGVSIQGPLITQLFYILQRLIKRKEPLLGFKESQYIYD